MIKQAIRALLLGLSTARFAAAACTRTYYIAADELVWDYVPTNINQYDGTPITTPGADSAVFTVNDAMTIGQNYTKAIYQEYTDYTFTKLKPKPVHLGYLGPVIRAEVNDTIVVVFRNNAGAGFTPPLQFSIHPHGVKYTKHNEGVHYQFEVDNSGSVSPGTTFTYTWQVPDRAGPGKDDGNAVMWAYHSHHNEVKDTYSGLNGPMVIYKPNTLAPFTNKALDVDREFFLLFEVMDENQSHYLDVNCAKFGCDPALVNADPDGFHESNLMHNINGRMYGNLDGLNMYAGENVRWFIAAFGTEVDLHTAHFHGNTLLLSNHRTDVIDLLPATFRTLSMQPDSEGKWLIHCHVNDHIKAGMLAFYNVYPKPVLRGTYPALVY